jgi:hypothetical protein
MDDLVNKRVRALAADRDQFLRRTLALELIELDQLQRAFRDKASRIATLGVGCFCSRLPSGVRPYSA